MASAAAATQRAPFVDFAWRDIAPVDGDLHLGWKHAVEGLPDVFWSPHYGGHWVLTRAADMARVYGDRDRFSTSDITVPPMSQNPAKTVRIVPAESDPPVQRDYRRLLSPAFGAARLARLKAEAGEIVDELIAGLRPRGGCDFVPAFAQRFPVRVFLSLADLPADDDAVLLPLVDRFLRGATLVERGGAFRGMMDYIRAELDRARGGGGSRVFGAILAGTVEERPVSIDEAKGACANLLFAGLDTVVGASSFLVRFLAARPAHARQLRDDPALIPAAVEELLRYHGMTNLARRVTADVELGGVTLPAGDMVLMPLTISGLDERAYPDPLTVDFRRRGAPNMVFGTGDHFCLGNRLARMELALLLERWLAAFPDFAVPPDAPVTAVSNGTNMMLSLPLSW